MKDIMSKYLLPKTSNIKVLTHDTCIFLTETAYFRVFKLQICRDREFCFIKYGSIYLP